MSLDLIIRVLLMGGTLINMMCILYVIGIAYVTPLITNSPAKYMLVLMVTPVVIVLSTVFSWVFFRADRFLMAMVAMFGWIVVYWTLFRDIFMMS